MNGLFFSAGGGEGGTPTAPGSDDYFVRFSLLLRLSFHEVDGMLSPKRVHRRHFKEPSLGGLMSCEICH